MRVAVWANLPPGGARRALRDHLRGLAERGHELHLVRPPIPSPNEMSSDAYCASVEVVPLEDLDGRGGNYGGRALAELRRSWRAVAALERHSSRAGAAILKRSPDVLFANTCRFLAAPSVVRHVGDLPRVTYLQEPKRSLYEADPALPWIAPPAGASRASRLRRRLTMGALARQARVERENASAATMLVNSRFSRESVMRAYGLDARVCYLGVDTATFSSDFDRRRGFVLGVGAIAPSKRIEIAIEACSRAGLPLRWIGPFEDPVYGPAMRDLAFRRGVEAEWRVGASEEEVVECYRRCLVHIAVPRLEPFGYTPLEAGACGAPVVAIAEGGFRETVLDGETGFLVSDAIEAAHALRRLADDPALASRLGAAGREFVVNDWSLAAATERLEAELLRAISGRSERL